MASRSGTRYNVLAGGFLLGCLALAVITSFVLSDARSRLVRTNEYTVRFSLQQGAVGLQPGSSVQLAGQKVGRVVSVQIAKAPLESPHAGPAVDVPVGVDVVVAVKADIVLYENASVFLDKPLLGSITTINITGVGSPDTIPNFNGASAVLEPGETIAGSLAPPGFLAQAGFGPEQIKQVRQVLADTQAAMARISKLIEQDAPLIENTLTDVRAIASSIREKWPQWSGSADNILANVQSASGRFDTTLATADAAAGDARRAIADVRDLIEKNRAKLDNIVANADAAMARVNQESIPIANDALVKGRDAMQSFSAAAQRTDHLIAEQTPNIRRTLANARLASDQMKLVMAEIRAAPWRVLFRPSTKEQETELLYDAVRAYATAVSDLRAAGESLESAAGSDLSPQALDRATLEEMTSSLRARFEDYQRAEQTLFNRLLQRSDGKLPGPTGPVGEESPGAARPR